MGNTEVHDNSILTTTSWRRAVLWLTQDRLSIGLLLVIVFAASLVPDVQSDTWWNLASGRLTWESRRVWLTDPLSWTVRGAYWPNHEWLAQVIYYVLYRLAGGWGLDILFAVTTTLTWVFVYKLCTGAPRLRVLPLLLGIISHILNWSVRPHMFTFLALALLLVFLQQRDLHKWIPPLFLVWANLHGGVGLGGLALVLAALAGVLCSRRDVWHWVRVTGSSAVATLCTPLGIDLWRFTLSKLNLQETLYLQEWLPPSLGWPISYPFFILSVVWLFLVVRNSRYLWQHLFCPGGFWSTALLFQGGVFMLLGFISIRHTVLFTIVALPLIAKLAFMRLPVLPEKMTWQRGFIHVLLALMVVIGSVSLVVYWLHTGPARWHPFSPALIAELRRCPGKLYNTFDTGGAVMWFVPERPVFVDSRNDPYSIEFLHEAGLVEQSGQYEILFGRYDVNCALVQCRLGIYQSLQKDRDWAVLYDDARFAVFEKQE